MTASMDDLGPDDQAETGRDWYFDDDGSLASATGAPKFQEWFGMGYALVGLALGSPTWLTLGHRVEGNGRGADATSSSVAQR